MSATGTLTQTVLYSVDAGVAVFAAFPAASQLLAMVNRVSREKKRANMAIPRSFRGASKPRRA